MELLQGWSVRKEGGFSWTYMKVVGLHRWSNIKYISQGDTRFTSLLAVHQGHDHSSFS